MAVNPKSKWCSPQFIKHTKFYTYAPAVARKVGHIVQDELGVLAGRWSTLTVDVGLYFLCTYQAPSTSCCHTCNTDDNPIKRLGVGGFQVQKRVSNWPFDSKMKEQNHRLDICPGLGFLTIGLGGRINCQCLNPNCRKGFSEIATIFAVYLSVASVSSIAVSPA